MISFVLLSPDTWITPQEGFLLAHAGLVLQEVHFCSLWASACARNCYPQINDLNIAASQNLLFFNLCALVGNVARKQTILTEESKVAYPLMCTSAHGNNRLIKSDQKKINNVDVAPGHRSREKLRWCVPLFSFLQLFYFSDPPQAKTKHFTLCGQSIIATWMDASGFILRPWKEVSKRTRRVAEANDSGALMMARFKEDESIVHQAAGRGADILLHRRLVCVVNYIPL